jgi:hypothetical protein
MSAYGINSGSFDAHVLWQWQCYSLGATLGFGGTLWLVSHGRVADPMVRCCGVGSCVSGGLVRATTSSYWQQFVKPITLTACLIVQRHVWCANGGSRHMAGVRGFSR